MNTGYGANHDRDSYATQPLDTIKTRYVMMSLSLDTISLEVAKPEQDAVN
jgi:hypothetical protein